MCSVSARLVPDDRTARARIRDAAVARFAAQGVTGTSLREIAEDAGVSAPLVVHHFGSKERLRQECDLHVAAIIRERKRAAVAQGPRFDVVDALRTAEQGPPILRYLARTLGDGTAEVAALVDEFVADAVAYMEEGVRTGMLKPSDYPRERAVVLTVWSLGALVLHEHVQRLLGVDLTALDAAMMAAYGLPATEVLGRGVLAEGVYEHVRDALAQPRKERG